MIHSKPGFGLPLVHHLVQQGVLDLGPWVPRDVTPTDGDIERAAGLDLDRELAQTGAHAARKPDRDLVQGPAEVLGVKSLVKAGESVQEDQIARAGPLPRAGPRPGRGVLLYRKRQELALGRPPEYPGDSRIQEPDNRLEDTIRGKGIASMNAENAPVEAEHHRSVGMSLNVFDVPEAESLQSGWEAVFEPRRLPRCPADPLTICPAAPLPRVHSP
jgi:hypothetical protein